MGVMILSFSELGLLKQLADSLESSGYASPTPLQTQLIPLVNERKNIIAWSQSASGKTGAFLIPLVNYLIANPAEEHRGTRVLVLTSRRDRVNQINYTLKRITPDLEIRSGFISSGRPYQHQMRLLRRPLDILIATPGRLNDLVENNKADFSRLEALVIDDLTTIYHKDLHGLFEKILAQSDGNCPTIAFVRDDEEVTPFVRKLLPDAMEIEVEEEKHPLLRIPQIVHIADDHTHKIALMDHMLDELEDKSVLIFTATTKGSETLAENLDSLGHAAVINSQIKGSNKPITSRDYPVLVVADQTMGNSNINFGSYTHIIHFDLPHQIPNYKNRITGKGWEQLENPVVLLIGPHERPMLKKIESHVDEPLEQKMIAGLEPINPYIPTPLLTLGNTKKSGKNNNRSGRKKGQHKRQQKIRQGKTQRGNGNGSNNNQQQKQRKGPYGRLNGGIHRKRNMQDNANNKPVQKKKRNTRSNNTTVLNNRSPSDSANWNQPAPFDNESQMMGEKKPRRQVVIHHKVRKRRSPPVIETENTDKSAKE
jgi:superfamily II DNA/RNA helicase